LAKHKKKVQQATNYSEYSRENVASYHKKNRGRKVRRALGRTILTAFVCVVALVGVVAYAWLNNLSSRMAVSSEEQAKLNEVLVETEAPGDPYYVLLLGCDGRSGETDYRSDTIILARVDPQEKKVTMLSIPRDTMITYKGSTMKINAAHYYDGPSGSVAAVSELCGVNISHYIEVNFNDFKKVVKAVGTVTVDVDVAIDDPQHFEDIYIPTGVQELDADEAMAYCRSRNFPDGDYTRMRHQRTFLTALMKKVTSSDPVTIVSFINSFADVVTTDLTATECASMAIQLQGIDTENNVYTAHAPSTTQTIDGVSYVIVDETSLAQMMEVIDSGGDPSTVQNDPYAASAQDADEQDDTTTDGTATTDGTTTDSTTGY